MIQSRGKFPQKVLVLPARDAARRFVPCRLNNRGHRDSWRPIVLRWRQRLRGSVNAPTGRATPAVKSLWFPQFHFHLATCLNDRPRSNRSASFLIAAGIHQTRVWQNHHRTSVRVAASPMQPSQTFRSLRAIHASNASWRQVSTWADAPSESRPPIAQPIAPGVAHRPRLLVFERLAERVRASTQREQRTPRFPSLLQIRQHFLQMLSLRAPTPSDHVPHRSQENKSLRVHFGRPEELAPRRRWRSSTVTAENGREQERLESFHRSHRRQESKRFQLQFDNPEELVWHRGVRSPTAMAQNGDQERPESSHRQPLQSMPSHAEAPAVSPAIERTAATQLTKIDPGLMDRLADDVIRRVEKRLRIERERRGL